MSEREAVIREVAEKLVELNFDTNHFYGWLRAQQTGRARPLVDYEVARQRRAFLVPAKTTPAQKDAADFVDRKVRAMLADHARDVEYALEEMDELDKAWPPPGPAIDCDELLPLLEYHRDAKIDLMRLRGEGERAADVVAASESLVRHVQERVLELFGRNLRHDLDAGELVLRIGNATQLRMASYLREGAVWYALLDWWKKLVEPRDSPLGPPDPNIHPRVPAPVTLEGAQWIPLTDMPLPK